MWVTYFENMPQDESFFRSYSEFLRQTEVNGELTYIINGAIFEKEVGSGTAQLVDSAIIPPVPPRAK